MTRLMETLKISTDEQLLIKYYVIKHLILLEIQNMMDINVNFHQWFINFLIKKILVLIFQVMLLKVQLGQTKN